MGEFSYIRCLGFIIRGSDFIGLGYGLGVRVEKGFLGDFYREINLRSTFIFFGCGVFILVFFDF